MEELAFLTKLSFLFRETADVSGPLCHRAAAHTLSACWPVFTSRSSETPVFIFNIIFIDNRKCAGTRCDVTLDHRVDAVCNVVTWLLHTDTNSILLISTRPEDTNDSHPETYSVSCTNFLKLRAVGRYATSRGENPSELPDLSSPSLFNCLPGYGAVWFRRQVGLLTFRRNILPSFSG